MSLVCVPTWSPGELQDGSGICGPGIRLRCLSCPGLAHFLVCVPRSMRFAVCFSAFFASVMSLVAGRSLVFLSLGLGRLEDGRAG